jgi:hypothetical protein
MDQSQQESINKFFNEYIATFYGDDDFINNHIKLKEDHTRRTLDEMLFLADQLNLNDNQKRIAAVIALLHDIGRFEQFKRYHTYYDPKSTDHCRLSLDIIEQYQLLKSLPENEKQLIEKAIENHNKKSLPGNLDPELLLFSRLIRDADKIDIYYVIIQSHKHYYNNPDQFYLQVELPDEPSYNPQIIESIMAHRQTEYSSLKTLNDLRLCMLGWVYDLNFIASLKRIKQRRYLEQIISFLPHTPDIRRVEQTIFSHIDRRIEQYQQ